MVSSQRLEPDPRTKDHLFGTVYYPGMDVVVSRPYGVWVPTVGAVPAVDKPATGLTLTKATDVLEVTGSIDAGVRVRVYALGGTLAAARAD